MAGIDLAQRRGQRAVERGERLALHLPSAQSEQAERGRVGHPYAPVQIQHQDPAGRLAQHAGQELLLLLEAHPLVAQRIEHPVVHADQPVDGRLPDLPEPRHQIRVLEQLRAVADEVQRRHEPPDQEQAGDQRREEDHLHREQPQSVRANQPDGQAGHQAVDHRQVQDEPRPLAHTGISYFSNRR